MVALIYYFYYYDFARFVNVCTEGISFVCVFVYVI